ncbi:serine/threonine-protein kinase [Nocardia sp. CDC153]|uniref:serine/threonine-protein kinase n=1 Tax=Nocardia sp. CDC153 TaxID=3112167 RepID=UPI002DC00475|nr:serine/threonine-protein kinase [Nocardia sp. CDC153]MEC3954490.1 serine/threonine-protein kinase [Nocardia sp. CDC153]
MSSGRAMVDGRFELLEPLGSGGMGTVWRAYDIALHREVALKEVRAEGDTGSAQGDTGSAEQQRERVLREARALARITHPNVVAIHHIVDTPAEKHPWIVMELVAGGSLADKLAEGPMPPAHAAWVGRGILAGLRAAHAVGVLHRDVKPPNVLLRTDGSPVLTDFGIAAVNDLTGLTSTGSVVGSLPYVAPERLQGHEGNPASDLWSLGLVLFAAVEGYQPMRRDTDVATLAAVLMGSVPPPRQAGPLTPVLNALLVPNPGHRPPADQVDRMLAQVTGENPAEPPAFHQLSGPNRTVTAPREFLATPPPRPYSPQPPPQGFHAPLAYPPIPPDPVTDAPQRNSRPWIFAGGAVVLVAAAVAAIALWPSSSDGQGGAGQPPGRAQPSGIALPSGVIPPTVIAPTTAKSAATVDLLTPDGMRTAVAALEKVAGGKQFTETTIYPEYVITGAPVPNEPKHYDKFTYRNGAATHDGIGGRLTDPTIDLSSVNWDILPTLLATAAEQLKVPNPTSRYIIVDTAGTFTNGQQVLRVYLSTAYGDGGYVSAALDGTILRVYAK